MILADATAIDLAARKVILSDGEAPFDFLVLATGARHFYFGNDGYAKHAPGLKTIEDALEIRRRLRPTSLRRMLGAFVDGRLVGTVGYSRETYPKERHRVVIWGVYVAPEVRRGGIGRALMAATIGCIRRLRGVDTVVLSVSESAPGARALYRSLGFRPYGLDKRALKVGGKFVAEEPMVLALR